MSVSQNGWPAGDSVVLDKAFNIHGATFPGGVRSGDVATVLGYVVAALHARVEQVHPGWCWGYYYRLIRGASTGLSNHSSATAVDYNAPAHPRGVAGTFSPAQVSEIHEILREVGNVVRWGGDYTSGPKDDMHFEIVAGASAVKVIADRLRSKAAKPAGTAVPATMHPSVVPNQEDDMSTIVDLPAHSSGGSKVIAVHPKIHWQMTIASGEAGSFELQHVRNWTAAEGHGSGGDLALEIHPQEGETFTIPPNTQKVVLVYTSTADASLMVHPLPA
jgi:D-alanyl-D-alanine carboxypeptidase